MAKHIDTAEVAKLVRENLKLEFPGIKFSVRIKRYSGGSSIRVDWTDGPTSYQVKEVTSFFQGGSFDGMQDLMSYTYLTNEDGEQIHYGADFIFPEREYSREFTQAVAEHVAAQFYVEVPTMNDYNWYDYDSSRKGILGNQTIIDLIREAQQHATLVNGKLEFSENSFGWVPGWLSRDIAEVTETPAPEPTPAVVETPAPLPAEPVASTEDVAEAEMVEYLNYAKLRTIEAKIEQTVEKLIAARLAEVDLNTITPLQALNLLSELKAVQDAR